MGFWLMGSDEAVEEDRRREVGIFSPGELFRVGLVFF